MQSVGENGTDDNWGPSQTIGTFISTESPIAGPVGDPDCKYFKSS